MKKRDYNLIKEGKFNRVAIMQQAWAYVRHYGYSLKYALSEAWQAAKEKMRECKWQERVAEAAKNVNVSKDYNPYNDKNIPSSAFYSNSTGLMGAHYVGD